MKSKLTNRIWAVALVAVVLSVLLAVSSFAANITGGNGKFEGEVAGYEAASVTINAAGNGLAVDTNVIDLDTANSGLAGLYKVRATGATEWESGVIYVNGKVADKKAIHEISSGKIATGGNATTFVPGKVSALAPFYAGTAIASYQYLDSADTYKMIDGTKPDATAQQKKAAEDALKSAAKSYRFNYALTTKEIIPISSVNKFSFSKNSFETTFIYPDNVARFDVYVADAQGTVKTYSWYSPATRVGDVVAKFTVDFESEAGWETPLPTDGYFIGYTIYPMWGVVDVSKVNMIATAGNPNYWRIGGIYLDNTYDIDTEKGDKPSDVTINERTLSGLDPTKKYTIAPYTILGPGTPLVENYTGAETYTFTGNDGGVYAVMVSADDYTAASDPVLFYVYGKWENRQKLGTITGGAPAYKGAAELAEWIPGTYIGQVYGKSDKFFFSGYSYQIDTKVGAGKALYDAWVAAVDSGDPNAIAATKAALDASRQRAKELYEAINLRYAYAPDEIIPISEVKTMTFKSGAQYNPAGIKTAKYKVELYVLTADGKVTMYPYVGETYSIKSNGYQLVNVHPTLNVQEDVPNLPSEGWLVGYKFYPTAVVDINEIEYVSSPHDGARYRSPSFSVPCEVFEGSYEITIPKFDRPDYLELDGMTVSGFDPDVTYLVAPYTVLGAEEKSFIVLDDDNTFTFEEGSVGLWGISILGDEYKADSDPFVVYIEGPSDTRKDIFTYDEGTGDIVCIKGIADMVGQWKLGTVMGYGYYDAATKVTDMHALINDWQCQFGKGYSADDLKAAINANNPAALELMRKDMRTLLQKQTLRYAMTSDEIIETTDLFSLKFTVTVQNSDFAIESTPQVSFYVMDSTGEISEYRWTGEKQFAGTQVVDVQATEGLPETGWIVAFEIRPFGILELDGINPDADAGTKDQHSTYCSIGYNSNYVIKEDGPTPTIATFPVVEGGYGEMSGLRENFQYEYQLYDEEAGVWSEWADVPAGVTAFRVTKGGQYRIRVKDTETYGDSEIVEITLDTYGLEEGYTTFASEIAKMHLPNDFVELKAEYEIDVTFKNWISRLVLENLKAVAPESKVTIVGDGYKFVVTPANFTVESNKAHYFDMSVSFDGESRLDTTYEALRAKAGKEYLTEIYFESSTGLPFEAAEFMVYLGEDRSGADVELRSYNERIDKLRNVETATVIDGWVTFTNFTETYVVLLPE